ncbi:MAG TPA: glycosyltransferase [Gemmatimonadaceae bacterium]|jgi:glycosyltransferase involved in cell wall biosynthesis|nr:glycosyltransferase [Gemmatimonadaceae bacterium]
MKIAIVHDYLNQAGGAERVVGTLHTMFPDAPIFTTILDRASLWDVLRDADIRTSWMQKLPLLKRHFKAYLLFYPGAIERFDLREYDLVISSSSAFGKAAITRSDAVHVCYCHTPMRFVWDYERYMEREQYGSPVRAVLVPVLKRFRTWDVKTSVRPHVYVANSTVVADRIRRFYGRESVIVPPPVAVQRFTPVEKAEDFYLIVSRLNPYKRVDLVVKAFNDLGRPLVIIGDGPDRAVLEAMAKPNIKFLGRLPDPEVAQYYARCRALLFPGDEDFGIVPLEANAAGRPVIAYKAGGALDTVVDGKTGIFFSELTPESLTEAVLRAESTAWDSAAIRRHAEEFAEPHFRERFMRVVEKIVQERLGDGATQQLRSALAPAKA